MPARSSSLAVLALVASIGMAGGVAGAGTGDLDPTFGDEGIATIIGSHLDQHAFTGVHVAPTDSGGAWTAGTTSNGYTGGDARAVITKLRRDGGPDRSFGRNGQKVWQLSRHGDYPSTGARSVEAIAGGKVQISGSYSAGSSFSDPQTAFLARFEADGSPDATFGRRGVVQHRFPPHSALASGTADDGEVMCGQYGDDHGERILRVWRHRSDGSVDTSFGGDGRVLVRPIFGPNSDVTLQSCALTASGAAIAVLTGTVDSVWVVAVIRLLPNGELDESFGAGGIARTSQPEFVYLSATMIDPDGGVVLAGRFHVPGGEEFRLALFALDRDGQPDPAFGEDGLVVTDSPELRQAYPSTAPRRTADGSILVLTGVVARFSATGELDVEFGGDGVVAVPFVPIGVTVDSQGRVLLGGRDPGDLDAALVARLQR